MPAKSDIELRFVIEIHRRPYWLTVTADGFRLVHKGKRKAIELPWSAFLDEDAAMMSQLQASMRQLRRSQH
jgi:hypothetical protein